MTTSSSWLLRLEHDWYELRIAAITTIAISSVSTAGRVISRQMERHAFLPDDWLIVTALAVAISASVINIIVSANIDSGKWWPDYDTMIQKWAFITQLHWIVAIALTSHSYIAFLWRFFKDAPQGRKLRYCHILVGLWALGAILGVVLGLGLPVSRYWESGPGPQYWARLICTTSLHILIDLGILGIPIPWILKLDTPRLYRNLVFGIFFLGLLTMAATCVRFAYLLKRYHAESEQRIEYAIFAAMWMLIEINTAICVANLPTLGPVLLWLPNIIVHACKRFWASIKTKRDIERIGPFAHRPPRPPKSPNADSNSESSIPQVISRSPNPQVTPRSPNPQVTPRSPTAELIARRSTPELSATPRYGPVYYEMMGLPNSEERELEQLVSAHTDAV